MHVYFYVLVVFGLLGLRFDGLRGGMGVIEGAMANESWNRYRLTQRLRLHRLFRR